MNFTTVAVGFLAAALALNAGSVKAEEATKDIVDTAVAAGSFKTLVAALKAADLVDTLKSKGPFTVLAPTDDAFAKLHAGTVETLLKPENKAKLVKILTYHVIGAKTPNTPSTAECSTSTKPPAKRSSPSPPDSICPAPPCLPSRLKNRVASWCPTESVCPCLQNDSSKPFARQRKDKRQDAETPKKHWKTLSVTHSELYFLATSRPGVCFYVLTNNRWHARLAIPPDSNHHFKPAGFPDSTATSPVCCW